MYIENEFFYKFKLFVKRFTFPSLKWEYKKLIFSIPPSKFFCHRLSTSISETAETSNYNEGPRRAKILSSQAPSSIYLPARVFHASSYTFSAQCAATTWRSSQTASTKSPNSVPVQNLSANASGKLNPLMPEHPVLFPDAAGKKSPELENATSMEGKAKQVSVG